MLTHFALLPYALLHLASSAGLTRLQRWVLGYFLGGTAAIVLMVTPYGGILAGLLDEGFPLAFAQGLGAGFLLALPCLVILRVRPLHVAGWLVGAAECGLQAHLQARYLLPAVILLAATGQRRPWTYLNAEWTHARKPALVRGGARSRSAAERGSSSLATTDTRSSLMIRTADSILTGPTPTMHDNGRSVARRTR